MGAMQRRKGAVAEREILRLLGAELGEILHRNIQQTRDGGADCLQVKGFAIEVKRCERLSRPTWWRQTLEQAERVGAEPLLFYRRSRQPWTAFVHVVNGRYRTTDLAGAASHIREKWLSWP